MALGLGLGLTRRRRVVGGEPYSNVLALEYDLTQIAEPTTIALAIKADGGWFDAGQEAYIDWGDGTTHTVVSATSGQDGYISHEYTTAATYLVKVSGTMKAYQRAGLDDLAGQDLLTHIHSFGKLGIESFMYAFYNCTGLISVPKYCPKSISDMAYMFRNCSGAAFNPDFSAWNVSNVKNMAHMFGNCSGAAFNPDVSNWDVSNVTDMRYMFRYCSGAAFNPDVSTWNVSNVENMAYMFRSCSGASFNGNGIKNWKLKSGVNSVNMNSFMTDAKVQAATWLDEILLAWAALIGDPTNPLPSNITITFPTNQPYTGSVSGAALTALVAHGWTISTLVDVEA